MCMPRAAKDPRIWLFAVAVLLLSAAGAFAREPVRIYGLTIPDRVAGLPHEAPFDYEKTNPGLGYSVQFIRPGWRIDVYIYDARQASIPDDPQSAMVKGQLEEARRNILELQQRGAYGDVKIGNDYAVERRGKTRFVCSALTYHHKEPMRMSTVMSASPHGATSSSRSA